MFNYSLIKETNFVAIHALFCEKMFGKVLIHGGEIIWPGWNARKPKIKRQGKKIIFYVLRFIWANSRFINSPSSFILISWKDFEPLAETFLTICLGLDACNPFCHISPTFVPRLRGSRGLTLSPLSYKRRFPSSLSPLSYKEDFHHLHWTFSFKIEDFLHHSFNFNFYRSFLRSWQIFLWCLGKLWKKQRIKEMYIACGCY